MPHTRMFGSQERPLQSREAFTNRTYRFRRDFNVPDWSRCVTTAAENHAVAEEEIGQQQESLQESMDIVPPSLAPNGSGDESDKRSANVNARGESMDSKNYWDFYENFTEQELLNEISAPHSQEYPDMVPLFAIVEDESLAALQSPRLDSPRAVLFEWAFGNGLATGVYMVMRPRDAPRWVDPETGLVHQNVAALSQEEIHQLATRGEVDQDLRWFE